MIFTNTAKKKFKVRETVKTFLYLPILYKGKFHWLSQVKLERAYNGYRMMIIDIQKA